MRSYSAPDLAYLQSRNGYVTRNLLWLRPRDRDSGDRVGMGFWTGEEDATFSIDGDDRLYQGGGALLGIDPIVMQAGLSLRMQRVTLSPLHDGVALALRGYDAWRAPAEIHRAFFDPLSRDLIAPPHQMWRGVVDSAPIQTPAIGGKANVEMTLSSAAEGLTHGLTATRSDAVQRQRSGDRFYQYKDLAGSVSVSWGEARAVAPTPIQAAVKKAHRKVFDGQKR